MFMFVKLMQSEISIKLMFMFMLILGYQYSLHLRRLRKSMWFCICPPDAICDVHDGYCSLKSYEMNTFVNCRLHKHFESIVSSEDIGLAKRSKSKFILFNEFYLFTKTFA